MSADPSNRGIIAFDKETNASAWSFLSSFVFRLILFLRALHVHLHRWRFCLPPIIWFSVLVYFWLLFSTFRVRLWPFDGLVFFSLVFFFSLLFYIVTDS